MGVYVEAAIVIGIITLSGCFTALTIALIKWLFWGDEDG